MSQRAVPAISMQPMFPLGERNEARCCGAAGEVMVAVVRVTTFGGAVSVTVLVPPPQPARSRPAASAAGMLAFAVIDATICARPPDRARRYGQRRVSASRKRLAWLLPVALILGAVAWAALDGRGSGPAPTRPVAAVSRAPAVVASPHAQASPPPAQDSPAPALLLAGRTITVDPGHNGGNFDHPREIARLVPDGNGVKECDTTGTAAPDGYRETDFNWSVARRLRSLLLAAGAKVVMTRASNDGVGPCVNERAAIGNRARSDAAISIHGDGGPPGGSGFAVLLPAPIPGGDDAILAPSRRLGLDVRSALLRAGLHTSTYNGRGGLAPRTDLGGLNLSRVPKVFVEVANMQNAADEAPMERPAFRERVAAALLAARWSASWRRRAERPAARLGCEERPPGAQPAPSSAEPLSAAARTARA